MAYRIDRDESVPAATRRIIGELLDGALRELADNPDRANAVHQVRKRLKESRAVLRLVRSGLGEAWRLECSCLAEAGRRIGGIRDADVVVTALDRLVEEAAEGVDPVAGASIRTLLVARRDALADGDAPVSAVREVASALGFARTRIEAWPFARRGFDAIEEGLRRTHGDSRAALAVAAAGPSPEHLHAWRKRVKDSWYHSQLLRELWPEMMTVYRDALGGLSRTLGEHHDLTLLAAALSDEAVDHGAAAPLLRRIEQRQREIGAGAVRQGMLLYSETPAAWAERMRAQWSVWRSDA